MAKAAICAQSSPLTWVAKWEYFYELLEEFSRISQPRTGSEEGSQFSDWTGPRTWNWVATPRGTKTDQKQIKHISSRHPGRTDSSKNMENPNEDTLCNCGTFLNNFLIKYNKDQIVLKTLLCTMMRKIEQLEEVPHSPIDRPQAGRCRCTPCIPATNQSHISSNGDLTKNSPFKWGLWPATKTTCSQ
jgi:hypothetical protein